MNISSFMTPVAMAAPSPSDLADGCYNSKLGILSKPGGFKKSPSETQIWDDWDVAHSLEKFSAEKHQMTPGKNLGFPFRTRRSNTSRDRSRQERFAQPNLVSARSLELHQAASSCIKIWRFPKSWRYPQIIHFKNKPS